MPSSYFFNIDPSPAKLRMFFGRRQEIQAISNPLRNGDSVLLIGERRIGKTFLLYMIGDIARGRSDLYEQLLDRETGALLAELRNSTASYHWPYVDMLAVTSISGFYFKVLTELSKGHAERFASLAPIDHTVFLKELTRLSEDLSCKGQRAVVLVDESEKLLELDGSASVLSCLKAAIQQCEAVDFVLAGDIKLYQETAKLVGLEGALRIVYLGPLDLADAKALVQIPTEGQLSFEESALQRILELTGGKPSLIQILCDHLYERVVLEGISGTHITLIELNRLWESALRDQVFGSFGAVLRDFFEGLQGDERNIFCFLAHHPLTTVDDVAEALGIQTPHVRGALHQLCQTRRVVEEGAGFRIMSKIVEEFGSHFILCPCPIVEDRHASGGQVGEVRTLQDIIVQSEGASVEFKSSLRWDYHRNTVHRDIEETVGKTLAAFLNTGGGTLVIGIDDERHVVGLNHDYDSFRKKDRDGFELHLMKLISDYLGKNTCPYVRVNFYTIDQLEVCAVDVAACSFPVYAGEEDIFYIRTGNQTQRLNPREAVEYVNHHWGKRL